MESSTPIFNLMMSQYHSSTLVIFGRLGLFDFIHGKGRSNDDGVTVEELAAHAKWSIRATSAMLISLAVNGVLETDPLVDAHSFQHKYKLSPLATKFLLSNVPGSIVSYLELFWECSPQQLLEKASVRKKQDNFMLETGGGGAPSSLFINAMQGQTSHAAMVLSPLLATHFDNIANGDVSSSLTTSDPKNHFVDVGGGSGTFCIEFCKVLPHWKGSIYELSGVCPIAQKFIDKCDDSRLSDRIQTVAGDMFKDRLFPAATCYGIGNVLHDWSDDDNKALLQKAYDSLSSGGKVSILEMLVAEDVSSTTNSAAGLNLVMVTNEDGRQYKASELKSMLENIGFVHVKVISSPLTPYSAIIAGKK